MLYADLGCLREAEESYWVGSEGNAHGFRLGMRKVVGTVLTCEGECQRRQRSKRLFATACCTCMYLLKCSQNTCLYVYVLSVYAA